MTITFEEARAAKERARVELAPWGKLVNGIGLTKIDGEEWAVSVGLITSAPPGFPERIGNVRLVTDVVGEVASMTDHEKELARISAHEAAGANSIPVWRVWAVSPDLTGKCDEVYFKTADEAIDYINENTAEKIDRDYTEEQLIRNGFTLRLFCKYISQEQYEAVFEHGESIDL